MNLGVRIQTLRSSRRFFLLTVATILFNSICAIAHGQDCTESSWTRESLPVEDGTEIIEKVVTRSGNTITSAKVVIKAGTRMARGWSRARIYRDGSFVGTCFPTSITGAAFTQIAGERGHYRTDSVGLSVFPAGTLITVEFGAGSIEIQQCDEVRFYSEWYEHANPFDSENPTFNRLTSPHDWRQLGWPETSGGGQGDFYFPNAPNGCLPEVVNNFSEAKFCATADQGEWYHDSMVGGGDNHIAHEFTVDKTEVNDGDTLTYTLTVTNNSGGDIPYNLSFDYIGGLVMQTSDSGIGSLAPGETKTFNATAIYDAAIAENAGLENIGAGHGGYLMTILNDDQDGFFSHGFPLYAAGVDDSGGEGGGEPFGLLLCETDEGNLRIMYRLDVEYTQGTVYVGKNNDTTQQDEFSLTSEQLKTGDHTIDYTGDIVFSTGDVADVRIVVSDSSDELEMTGSHEFDGEGDCEEGGCCCGAAIKEVFGTAEDYEGELELDPYEDPTDGGTRYGAPEWFKYDHGWVDTKHKTLGRIWIPTLNFGFDTSTIEERNWRFEFYLPSLAGGSLTAENR